jgi:hypothetical protein
VLSFDSRLTEALSLGNTTAFYVLKLYYNDESAFIGVSDKHRVDGSDIYYGLVASWGQLHQGLDFFGFTTSTGNTTVKLINTETCYKGGRFSDQFSTNNFANRKWELFLNAEGLSTYDTAARMVGSGIISGDIGYDQKGAIFRLLDFGEYEKTTGTTYYGKQLPSNIVDSSTYPNAPEKNINKPIPMAYGDFYEKTDIGTIPTSYFDRFKTFYNSAFPAIITDKFDIGEAAVEAYVDSETMHTLDSENVYYCKDGNYATITGTVDATTNNPRIEFSGSRCKAYFPLSSSGFTTSGTGTHINEANLSNGDFGDSSKTTIGVTDGNNVTINYGIEPVTKLGEFISAKALAKLGTVSATPTGLSFLKIGGQAFSSVSTNDEKEATLSFTSNEQSAWDFTGGIALLLNSNIGAGAFTIQISEMGMVVEFNIDNIETYKTQELHERRIRVGEIRGDRLYRTITVSTTKTILYPSEIDYVYLSGKGRKYGAWVDADSRDNGYDENDLIENPVYIIEDILRTELGLTSSEIDYATFDSAGNTTDGHIGLIYNDSADDVKFAFSQHKFIDSKDLINKLCGQALSWVFIGGDGKFKIKTLKRGADSDYSSADKTVDYNDIQLKSISRTPLNSVRNDITVNYNHDYGQDQSLSQVNTTDSTSAGTSVSGYNQTLELVLDAGGILDSTTATQLADAYKAIFKDRKVIIKFDCLRPKYLDLEIGDIIQFSNWDTKVKLYGTALSEANDYFMITDIGKKLNGCSIEVIKVQ